MLKVLQLFLIILIIQKVSRKIVDYGGISYIKLYKIIFYTVKGKFNFSDGIKKIPLKHILECENEISFLLYIHMKFKAPTKEHSRSEL